MNNTFEDIRSIVYCHSFDLDVDFTEGSIFYYYVNNSSTQVYRLRVYEWHEDRISIFTTKEGEFEVSGDKAISINLVLHLIHKLNEKPCEYCSIGGLEDHSDYESFRLTSG